MLKKIRLPGISIVVSNSNFPIGNFLFRGKQPDTVFIKASENVKVSPNRPLEIGRLKFILNFLQLIVFKRSTLKICTVNK